MICGTIFCVIVCCADFSKGLLGSVLSVSLSNTLEAINGSRIQIRCRTDDAVGNYKWYTSEKMIPTASYEVLSVCGKGSRLCFPPSNKERYSFTYIGMELFVTISKVDISDEKYWICANGGNFNDSKSLFLNVTVSVTSVSMYEPLNLMVQVNKSRNISCSTSYGRPAPDIKFYKEISGNSVEIPKNVYTTSDDNGITIGTLVYISSSSDDGAKFYCKAINTIGQVPVTANNPVTIVIINPPTLSINIFYKSSWRVGDAVVLECSVDTYSPVNVTWYNSKNQSLNSFNCGEGDVCLKLDRIQEQDTGTYFCRAATEHFDTAVKSVELYIESTAKDKEISETREKTLPWTYIGIGAAAAVVLILLIVTILVLERRRNTGRRETGHEDIPKNTANGQVIVNDRRDEQKGSDAYDSIIVATYANADNRDKGNENVKTAGPSTLKAEANTSEPVPIPEEQGVDLRDTETAQVGNPEPKTLFMLI